MRATEQARRPIAANATKEPSVLRSASASLCQGARHNSHKARGCQVPSLRAEPRIQGTKTQTHLVHLLTIVASVLLRRLHTRAHAHAQPYMHVHTHAHTPCLPVGRVPELAHDEGRCNLPITQSFSLFSPGPSPPTARACSTALAPQHGSAGWDQDGAAGEGMGGSRQVGDAVEGGSSRAWGGFRIKG